LALHSQVNDALWCTSVHVVCVGDGAAVELVFLAHGFGHLKLGLFSGLKLEIEGLKFFENGLKLYLRAQLDKQQWFPADRFQSEGVACSWRHDEVPEVRGRVILALGKDGLPQLKGDKVIVDPLPEGVEVEKRLSL
jgi:hypothetical protein